MVQSQSPYRNLVMEGGGIRGIAYIGALQVLDSAGVLAHIERLGGTSAGAIQAALLAVGYTPLEMQQHLMKTSFSKLNDGGFFAIPGAIRLSRQMGWYKGEALTNWLENLIAYKTNNRNITFQELFDQREQFAGKSLYVTATDLSRQRLVVFSHETYPNMRIVDAVRISASIPFYFKPLWVDDEGKVYEKADSLGQLSMMVDGGMLNNFPLNIFDSTRYISNAPSTINHFVSNPETLGLQLEEPEFVNNPDLYRAPTFLNIQNNGDYIKAIYKLLVDKTPCDVSRSISISNMNISSRVRQLPSKKIAELMASGRQSAIHFVDQRATTLQTAARSSLMD